MSLQYYHRSIATPKCHLAERLRFGPGVVQWSHEQPKAAVTVIEPALTLSALIAANILFWMVVRFLAAANGSGSGRGRGLVLEALEEPLALPVMDGSESAFVAEAIETLGHLRRMSDPSLVSVLGQLRQTNPYAFEELVAICLAERGMEAQTSPTYSHDGGVDALAFLEGRPVVVQVKRWRNHISAGDIEELAQVASRIAGVGLFIHTGRTGRASWRMAARRRVNILSGIELVRLALGHRVHINWVAPALPIIDPRLAEGRTEE